MRRATWVAIALALLAPSAAAEGEVVEILSVEVPPLVVAEVPFAANVTFVNHGTERTTAFVYAALYGPGEGQCGSQTSPRWRGVVSLSPGVAQVPLEAGEKRRYPQEGEGKAPEWVWLWRVNATWTPQAGEYEACVFAEKSLGAGLREAREAYDHESLPLRVRPTNAPPSAEFSWSPLVANATTPIVFEATALDPDGDPVRLMWDFGHSGAAGRARAVGARVEHRFWPEGDFTVTLRAEDPFGAAAVVVKTVRVLPESVPTPVVVEDPEGTPAVGAVAVVATVALAVSVHRRR
ncbi:MAG TPA: PKD domain-containing protein [Candidatus Thermoplasmatota archaeon]|nr:PKD domain-containing protein [Candidatus Thermoplasmatota archaeon]